MRAMAIFYLLFLILFWPAIIIAQDEMPEPMASTPGNPPPPGLVVPIDAGLILLLIAGLLLGGYFLLKFRRKLS